MDDSEDRTETKRDQIIQAAAVEFRENGFTAASMDHISARAGASKRTVYRYFESKEALFRTFIEWHWSRFATTLDVAYEPNRDIRDQLTDVGLAEGELLTSAEVMATTRMIMTELLRNPELADEDQEKTDYRTALATMLSDASIAGQLDVESPEEAAEEFIGLIKAKAFWPVILGSPVVRNTEMKRIVANSVEMMMCRYGRR